MTEKHARFLVVLSTMAIILSIGMGNCDRATASPSIGIPTGRAIALQKAEWKWHDFGEVGEYRVFDCRKPRRTVICSAWADGYATGLFETYRCSWTARIKGKRAKTNFLIFYSQTDPLCVNTGPR